MRAISDRKLPEPYRPWIDRAAPLPSSVLLLPRTIDVGGDGVTFLLLGGLLGVMGVLFVALPPWRFDPAREGWEPYLFFGGICAALWSVPLLLLRRLLRTIGARADQRRGTLRQGVFLGADGMLVRMEPNGCHPISADRFVVARIPSERPRDIRWPTLVIETLDGDVRFFAERLAAGPDEINRAASELWPSRKGSRRRARADRKRG